MDKITEREDNVYIVVTVLCSIGMQRRLLTLIQYLLFAHLIVFLFTIRKPKLLVRLPKISFEKILPHQWMIHPSAQTSGNSGHTGNVLVA